jgi:hypothetical protein
MTDIAIKLLSDAMRGGDTIATQTREQASEMGNANQIAVLLCTNQGLITPDHAPRLSRRILRETEELRPPPQRRPESKPLGIQPERNPSCSATGQPSSAPFASPGLNKNVEHDAALIHGAPKIMLYALDPDEHLVQVPLIPRLWPTATKAFGEALAKFVAPSPYGLI